jgi:hypothetical protein
MRKTKPIGPGRRVNVQNEPNLDGPQGQDVGRARRGAALHAGATPDQVGGRLYEACKTKPISPRPVGVPRRIVQNEPNLARPRAGPGGKMRKTNPISLGRRRLTEEILRNEPNLARPRAGAGG